MSPISGLRSRTLNGPFAPARGPATRCSTIVFCAGVISFQVSGLNRSPRNTMLFGSGLGCAAGACARATMTTPATVSTVAQTSSKRGIWAFLSVCIISKLGPA